MIRKFVISICLFFLALLPFARTSDYGAVNCDDYDYIARAHSPSGMFGVDEAIWMPLTWCSYKCDIALAKARFGEVDDLELERRTAALMHSHNIFLQGVNCVMLFLLFAALGMPLAWSALLSLFWAVHPLRCESVCWIASRKDLVSMFWMLAALIAWVKWVSTEKLRENKRVFFAGYFGSMAAFALSAAGKPSAMLFAPCLFIIDWLVRARIEPVGDAIRSFKEGRVAFSLASYWIYILPFALCAALAFFAGWAQQAGGAMELGAGLPLAARLANAIAAFGIYFVKSFYPARLAPMAIYSWPEMPVFFWQGLGVVFGFMGAVAALFYAKFKRGVKSRRLDFALAGLLWFAVAALPFLGIVAFGAEPHAERFTYVPAVGLSLLLFALLCAGREGRGAYCEVVVCALAVCVLGRCADAQCAYWRDDGALFKRVLAVQGERHPAALANLGLWHFENGHDLERAAGYFEQALKVDEYVAGRIYPCYFFSLFELGRSEAMKKVHQDFAIWDGKFAARSNGGGERGVSTLGYLVVHALYQTRFEELKDEGERKLEELGRRFPSDAEVLYARYLAGQIGKDAVRQYNRKNYYRFRFLRGKQDGNVL